MLISEAIAQETSATDAVAEPSPFAGILPLILIFVVFYFLLIRPQQKKLREHDSMVKTLRRGDKVVTGGGIMGTIHKIDTDGTVQVEIAPEIRVRVLQDTIASVAAKTGAVEGDSAATKKDGKKTANDNASNQG